VSPEGVPPGVLPPAGGLRVVRDLAPLFGVAVVSVVLAGGFASADAARTDGPAVADFDHAAHLNRGVECADCHVGVEEDAMQARAGTPSIEICAELCHGDFDEETTANLAASELGRLMVEHVASGEELWWPQAYWLPHHVVFSHRRHVAIAELECADCHGEIASSSSLPREAATDVLTMDGCMRCHESHGASNDCFACHR